MDPFAAANDAAFADDNFGMDALWRQQGKGDPVSCRIIRSRQSDVLPMQNGRIIPRRGDILEVRLSEIAQPQRFDSFEIVGPTPDYPDGRELLEIQAEPQLDELGLVWQCEVKPKA